MKQVRVLVVDDSPTMRAIIRAWLERDGEIAVVGEAGDAHEAREAIKALSPDVITLDVNMPRMDGLEFLEKLMRLRPTPVIMVSSEVGTNAAASIEALAAGRLRLRLQARQRQRRRGVRRPGAQGQGGRPGAARRAGARSRHTPSPAEYRPNGRIVAIGASTGGVDALMSVLSAFPANCPPTVVVQHMPTSFTRSFAQRLDQNCAAQVAEAWSGAPARAGPASTSPPADRCTSSSAAGSGSPAA